MAQITLNSTGVASDGALALQSNGTTTAVTISTAQNVGIGTASPARLLSLSAASPILRMTETGANSDLDFIVSTNSGGLNISVDANNEGANSFCAVSVDGSERMRIDSSGNVGIGTSSPDGKLHVSDASTGTTLRVVNTSSSSGSRALIRLVSATSTFGSGLFQTNGTDASYQTSALNLYAFDSQPLVFGTSNTERARIDSSGNLLVLDGNTSLTRNTNTSREVLSVIATAATATNQFGVNVDLRSDPNNTSNYFYAGRGNITTDRVVLRSNGGIANFSANNVNLSDRREKTNFAPAGDYLAKICAIPVQTFNYIDQNMEEDDGLTLGVVAQDVQAVAPEMVMESNWGTEEEPKMRLSIYQTDLQYALMKCIQEMKAIIDTQASTINSLTDRITALEAK
jgi:hypothetical protein